MKTITMDYEIYQEDLRNARREGEYCILALFEKRFAPEANLESKYKSHIKYLDDLLEVFAQKIAPKEQKN